jgi:hypothetical protein
LDADDPGLPQPVNWPIASRRIFLPNI